MCHFFVQLPFPVSSKSTMYIYRYIFFFLQMAISWSLEVSVAETGQVGEGATAVFIFQTVWGLELAFLQSQGHFFNLKGSLLCPCMAENYIPKQWWEKWCFFFRNLDGLKKVWKGLLRCLKVHPFIRVRVDSQLILADTDKPEQMCCSRMRRSLSSASVGEKKTFSFRQSLHKLQQGSQPLSLRHHCAATSLKTKSV